MDFTKILIVYLLIINLFALAQMGLDKKRSIARKWRISEKRLLLTAMIGGSIGSIAGMYTFRHKTQSWLFVVGLPLIFIIESTLIICFIKK